MFSYIKGNQVIIMCLLFGLFLYYEKMRKEHGVIWKTFTRHMEKMPNVVKTFLNVRYNEEIHKTGIKHVKKWSVWMNVMDEKYLRRRERIKRSRKERMREYGLPGKSFRTNFVAGAFPQDWIDIKCYAYKRLRN